MQQVILKNEADTQSFAQKIARLNPTGSLWLSGDLGVGKTTFTRYFLQSFGYVGAVKSPTFTLVEPYELMINGQKKPIYHSDLYRLNDPEELELMGFFEYFDEPNSLIIIEWASRAESVLPKPDLLINIIKLDNDDRLVSVQGMNFE